MCVILYIYYQESIMHVPSHDAPSLSLSLESIYIYMPAIGFFSVSGDHDRHLPSTGTQSGEPSWFLRLCVSTELEVGVFYRLR